MWHQWQIISLMADGYTIPSIYMFSKFDLSILVGVIRYALYTCQRPRIKIYDEAVCILGFISLGTHKFLYSH